MSFVLIQTKNPPQELAESPAPPSRGTPRHGVAPRPDTYLSYELKKFHRSRVQEIVAVLIAFKTLHYGIKKFPFHDITIIEFIL